MTINRETVSEFSRFFLRFLDRVFGEDTTGCVVDASAWLRGDKGGWLRIATSRRIFYVGTGDSRTLVSAEENLLRLLSPASTLFSCFVLEYRQREYELDLTLLPESVRAALMGYPLSPCIDTFGTEFLEIWFRSRGAKQSRSTGDRGQAETPTSLLLEPFEYFLVCMLRHPVAAPDVGVAVAAPAIFQQRSAARAGDDMIRGSNFLRLLQQYLCLYIPDEDAVTLTGSGTHSTKNTPTKTAASPVLRRSANATRSPAARNGPNPTSLFATTSGPGRNLELFLALCCCELMQRAVVVRRCFELVPQNIPHLANRFQYSEMGSTLHPSPLTVIVLNADSGSSSFEGSVGSSSVQGIPAWCPTVDSLQAIYLLVKRALTSGRQSAADLATHFECASSGPMKQHLDQLCSQQRGGYAAMLGSQGRLLGAVASLWSDKDRGDVRFVSASPSWCGTVVLQRLQQPIFDLLRCLFFHCNSVPHTVLCHAIELWLMVVQPWKHCGGSCGGSSYTDVWRPFVIANFHMYTTLLCLLLQTLSGAAGLGRQLNYSVKDGDSLRLLNYIDSALAQLFGGSAGGNLLDLLDNCGMGLRDLLRCCTSTNVSVNLSTSHVHAAGTTTPGTDVEAQSLSAVELFVLASHHRLLYPDPTVLTDLSDCGVIVSISNTCAGFVGKLYEILATLRVAYGISATAGIDGHEDDNWMANILRSLVGVGPVDAGSNKSAVLDKNSQRLDAIAHNIATVLRFCDKDVGSFAHYEAMCSAAATPSRGTQQTDSEASFVRRQRVVDMHLPASYFDNDVDRDVDGRMTNAGRVQLIDGERRCVPALVRVTKDSLDLPLGMYEVHWLTRLLISWSKALNVRHGLPREGGYTTVSWEDCYYFLFFYHSSLNSRAVQRLPWLDRWLQIPTAINKGFRINLRWLGNVRVAILGATLMAMLVGYVLVIVFWWSLWGSDSAFRPVAVDRLSVFDAAAVGAMVALVVIFGSLGGLLYKGRFDSVYTR